MKSLTSLIFAATVAVALPAHAQDFPTRSVTLVVSFAPGGLTDIPARILAPELQQRLGQSVIVESAGKAPGPNRSSITERIRKSGWR